MQFAILGPVQVRDGDRDLAVTGVLLRRLVARLALDAGIAVGQSELVATLWPADRPTDAVNALQSLVSRMRRLLGDGSLVQQAPGGGYRLDAARTDVDCWRAVEFHAAGRRELAGGHPAAAAATLTAARELFRGEPLADLADVPELAGAVGRFEELRLDVLAELLEAQLALGRAAEILPDLESLAAAELLRERFTGQLMTALAGTGRTAEALAAYERLRRHLADELGVDPSPALQDQHLRLLRGDRLTPAPPPATSRATCARSLTSFVGREAELGRIRQLLDGHRLITIVGPGGVGKTRLPREAAGAWVPLMRDGVWMVELAPVTDAAGVCRRRCWTPWARGRSTTLERLSRTAARRDAPTGCSSCLETADCLLVMDNCEHLIDAVAELVDRILGRCPGVRVLATSREPLGIVGEALAPSRRWPAAAAIARWPMPPTYPAVRLLARPGRRGRPGLRASTADTLAPSSRSCRRLDGLPLAIELAAARLRVLPVAEIASRLSRPVPAAHRRQPHRAAPAPDAAGRRRVELGPAQPPPSGCSPSGSRSSPPARRRERDGGRALDDRLDRRRRPGPARWRWPTSRCCSRRPAPEPRYRMLETIREYGVERLAEHGEVAAARRAHAALLRRAGGRPRAGSARRATSSRRSRMLDAERDNILAALRFLGDAGDARPRHRLAVALGWFWTLRGSTPRRRAGCVRWRHAGRPSPERRACREAMQAVTAASAIAAAAPGPAARRPERSSPSWPDRLVGRPAARPMRDPAAVLRCSPATARRPRQALERGG